MKIKQIILLVFSSFIALSCREYVDKGLTNYRYFDRALADTIPKKKLKAVTNEAYLQYGVNVAFVNESNDTVIPFGKYAYYGSDTLEFYANVMEHPNDSTYGRQIAIDRNEHILFDLVMFDNGPEPIKGGLTRVLRNGKMGYANVFGQVVIACKYDYVKWFENGKAEVTYNAKEFFDLDEHRAIESEEWFLIDKKGKRVE
ncbi:MULTISPECIES: WG repeat-containing protein [unclassified Algibacter]|uniref:WG repeat-containing protein n=1 Tax=unclassified Algibacter TaxID=2615009 RepID=UPI00131A820E|nr:MULTISPECIES: WG repeat-containing protein [unclassified Algibacter]MCL5129994.1 WG repeat-containing protein [Algibacter sp. L4_22]